MGVWKGRSTRNPGGGGAQTFLGRLLGKKALSWDQGYLHALPRGGAWAPCQPPGVLSCTAERGQDPPGALRGPAVPCVQTGTGWKNLAHRRPGWGLATACPAALASSLPTPESSVGK